MKNTQTQKLLLKFTAIASIVTLTGIADARVFNFQFKFRGQILRTAITSSSASEALDKASQQCINHFGHSQNSDKIKVDTKTADDLIDSCVNPKQSA